MLEILLNRLKQALTAQGFSVLDVSDSPKSSALRDKLIAFVSLNSVGCKQTGFDFESDTRKRIYSYTFTCRLLGREGDCSDRGQLLSKAHSLQLALIASGLEAELDGDIKINGALSRAQCAVKVTAELTHTPAGG